MYALLSSLVAVGCSNNRRARCVLLVRKMFVLTVHAFLDRWTIVVCIESSSALSERLRVFVRRLLEPQRVVALPADAKPISGWTCSGIDLVWLWPVDNHNGRRARMLILSVCVRVCVSTNDGARRALLGGGYDYPT